MLFPNFSQSNFFLINRFRRIRLRTHSDFLITPLNNFLIFDYFHQFLVFSLQTPILILQHINSCFETMNYLFTFILFIFEGFSQLFNLSLQNIFLVGWEIHMVVFDNTYQFLVLDSQYFDLACILCQFLLQLMKV